MPTGGATADHFEYRGWLVDIEVTASAALFVGHADLSKDGKHQCRVVLATAREDRATTIWALDSKARDFIDEWTSRRRPPVARDEDELA